MAQFTAKHTPEQRRAIVSLVLEGGRTIPAALSRASDGLEGLGPFEMNPSTAYSLVRAERQRRELAARRDLPPVERITAMGQRFMDLLDRELAKLEAEQAQGDELDYTRTTRLLTALKKARLLARETTTPELDVADELGAPSLALLTAASAP